MLKLLPGLLIVVLAGPPVQAAETGMRDDAAKALRRGVEFFRNEVAHEGTYLWQYSADLSKREGEGVATETQGWVQPPGTPAVGLALLAAWEATGDPFHLDAARETAYGLIQGQLRSGGWTYVIDTSPTGRERYAYRRGGSEQGRNISTLDDDTTQSALRFLVQLDRELKFADNQVRESVRYALEALLSVQYPNGAWSQGFEGPPDPGRFPVTKASHPERWPWKWPGSQQYWFRYTFNDNSLADAIELMFLVEEVYSDPRAGAPFNELAERCRTAAEKAGGFILLAQLPEPQPAWAQQYDFDMHPSWARKFEPPAVTGGESQGVLRTLLMLYRMTADRRFLEPVPRAIEYLQRSRLPDGRFARFYELETNRPLYFTKDYELTYDDSDVPTHYSFKVGDQTESILKEYRRLEGLSREELGRARGDDPSKLTAALTEAVGRIIATQDDRGRWVEDGPMRYHRPKDSAGQVINVGTFNRHVVTLSEFLRASRP